MSNGKVMTIHLIVGLIKVHCINETKADLKKRNRT